MCYMKHYTHKRQHMTPINYYYDADESTDDEWHDNSDEDQDSESLMDFRVEINDSDEYESEEDLSDHDEIGTVVTDDDDVIDLTKD